MLSRKNRVPRKLFPSLHKLGMIFHSPNFTLRTLSSKTPHGNRFSVVVSKKTASSAVDRNRIRRRVYAILEKQIPFVKVFHTTLLYPKNNLANISPNTLSLEIGGLLRKAGIL